MIRNKFIAETEKGEVKNCFAAHIYENRRECGLTDDEAMFAGEGAPLISLTRQFSMRSKEAQTRQGQRSMFLFRH